MAANCHVVAADQRAPARPLEGVTLVQCDITDKASVERAVAVKPIDYAIHLAAKVGDWGDRAEFERVNVEGTRNVLSTLHSAGIKRMIHISSIASMGFSPGQQADETVLPVTEGDVYSSTKAKGEEVARELPQQGAPIVIIRPGDVYGPGSEPWVNRPVRMMRSYQMLFIDGGTGHFGHVYVDNLIDAFLLALEKPVAAGQTYIVTDDEQLTTFKDYFTKLAKASASPVPRISIPKSGALLLAKAYELVGRRFGITPQITETAVEFVTKHCSYSIVKARTELGYAPRVGLEEGMERVREAFLGAGG